MYDAKGQIPQEWNLLLVVLSRFVVSSFIVTMWDAREDTGHPKQFSDIIRSTKNLAVLVGMILLFGEQTYVSTTGIPSTSEMSTGI